jgi:glycosyltransferase involved in cell wall biosynthesis
MAETEYSPENAEETPCRPVLFADPKSLDRYPNFFRSTLAGLVGSAYRAGLAGPAGSDLYTVLCPSVEVMEYPRLPVPVLHRRSREAFLDLLGRFKPTVLHGLWPAHARLLRRLSRMLNVPYVLSFFAPPGGGFERIMHPLVPADGWLAATEPIAEILRVYAADKPDRVITVPPGCYVEDECACFAETDRKPSMVLIQPLAGASDFDPFLRAVRHLLLDGHEFFLGILGCGRAEPAIRRRIRALGLASMISIVPIVETYRDVLSGADIFVRLKAKGRHDPSLLEAMSMGLAVVGCAEPVGRLLQDEKTGLVFDPADELGIYNALKKLLSRPQWARQLALAGQEYVRQNHQVSRMIEMLIETYLAVQKRHQESSKSQKQEG